MATAHNSTMSAGTTSILPTGTNSSAPAASAITLGSALALKPKRTDTYPSRTAASSNPAPSAIPRTRSTSAALSMARQKARTKRRRMFAATGKRTSASRVAG